MATEDLKPISRTTSLGSGVAITDFHKSMNDFAASTNTLGDIGSAMAQKASNTFAEHMGYENGNNPSGNVLPPLTKSMELYNVAYKAQSQATLGNKINQILVNGQIELSKSGVLTPELLESFNRNMPKGAQPLFDLAPDGVKQNLMNSFNNQMLQINGSLNTKMLGQQQKQKHESQSVANNESSIELYNLGSVLSLDDAVVKLQSVIDLNKANLANGVIGEKEYSKNLYEATLALHKGQYNGLVTKARQEGNLDKFLTNLANNKPPEMSFKEYEAVKSSVASNLRNYNSLNSQNSQASIALFKHRIDAGTFDSNDRLKAQSLPPKQRNSLIAYANVKAEIKADHDKVINDISSNWSSYEAHANSNQKDIDESFNKQAKLILQHQNDDPTQEPLSLSQIKQSLVLSSPVQIKSYTAEIESMLENGSGENREIAAKAWEHINSIKPKLIPISNYALTSAVIFSDQLSVSKNNEIAAQKTNEIMHSTKQDEIDYVASLAASYNKSTFNNNEKILKFATELVSKEASDIPGSYEFSRHVKRLMDNNIIKTHSISTAKKLTSLQVNKLYGDSMVNGKKQFVKMPIEKIMQLPSNKSTASLINADMANQIEHQFQATNKLFAEGQSDFWFRIVKKPDANKLFDLSSEFASLNSDNSNDGDYWKKSREHSLQKKEFENSGQVELEQVFRDNTVHNYKLSISAGMFVNESTDPENPIVGGYEITGTNEDGSTAPLIGVNGPALNGFYYHPNRKKLTLANYLINPNPATDNLSFEELIEKLKKDKLEKDNAWPGLDVMDVGKMFSFPDWFSSDYFKQNEQQENAPETEDESQKEPKKAASKFKVKTPAGLKPMKVEKKKEVKESKIPSVSKLKDKEKAQKKKEELKSNDVVNDSYYDKIAKVESPKKGMDAISKTGAIGKYQFKKSTWAGLVKDFGSSTGIGLNDITSLNAQEVMIRLFTKQNIKHFEKSMGRKPKEYEVYMAHVIGGGGAPRLIKHAGKTPNSKVTKEGIGSDPTANPLFFRNSKGNVRTYSEAVSRFKKVYEGVK